MSTIESLGDDLARDVIIAMEKINDDRLFDKVAKLVADSSPTLLESFTTAYRVRMAERRARKYLEAAIQSGKAAEVR